MTQKIFSCSDESHIGVSFASISFFLISSISGLHSRLIPWFLIPSSSSNTHISSGPHKTSLLSSSSSPHFISLTPQPPIPPPPPPTSTTTTTDHHHRRRLTFQPPQPSDSLLSSKLHVINLTSADVTSADVSNVLKSADVSSNQPLRRRREDLEIIPVGGEVRGVEEVDAR